MTLGLIQYVLGGKYLGKAGLASSGTASRLSGSSGAGLIGAAIVVVAAAVASSPASCRSRPKRSPMHSACILAGIVVAVLRLAADRERLLPRRAPALLGDPGAVHRLVAFLVGVRTGRLHAESVRGAKHEPARLGFPALGTIPRQLLSVLQFGFHHCAGAGVRLAVGCARAQRAIQHREVFRGADIRRTRLRHSDSRSPAGTNVSPWWLTADLSAAHHRRTLPEPGGPERDDQAGARAHRRTDDGRLVLCRFRWAIISAARLASVYESFPLPELFGIVAGFCIVVGLLLVFLLRPMKRLMGGTCELDWASFPVARQYRDQFPVTENLIYLNHAAVAPLQPPRRRSHAGSGPGRARIRQPALRRSGWRRMRRCALQPRD